MVHSFPTRRSSDLGTVYAIVNLKALGGFAANAVVDPDGLAQAGLIKLSGRSRVKVLGEGDVAHALTVRAHAVSEAARAKIEAKGGRVETLGSNNPHNVLKATIDALRRIKRLQDLHAARRRGDGAAVEEAVGGRQDA